MELKDTISLMTNSDYKERFRAEFFQLYIRMERLHSMLDQLAEGTLPFKPACSFELLSEQHEAMYKLVEIMEVRAKIEGIDLTMPE